MRDRSGLSTQSVHGGEVRPASGPVEAPLVLSSAFAFASAEQAAAAFRGEDDADIYGRWGTPNVRALEAKMAALEGGEDAVATASGMGAIAGALLTTCKAGDHLVAPRSMYAESARLLRERLPRFGITTTFVDDLSVEGFSAAIQPNTRVLYLETPSNPTLALTDLVAVAALGRNRGILTIADNTVATPACQRPLGSGIDLVVHSMTKALAGHGDAIGGAVVARRELTDAIRDTTVKGLGGMLAPFNAWLIARGMRTLALRVERSCRSAMQLASWLEQHREVERVHYPGLPSHPDHALALRQMTGFGALVAFELSGGLGAGRRVLERVGLVTHAVSLGDVRSLITHPASTTASTMPAADRRLAGIADGLLRLSVGIEDVADLIDDLDQAIR